MKLAELIKLGNVELPLLKTAQMFLNLEVPSPVDMVEIDEEKIIEIMTDRRELPRHQRIELAQSIKQAKNEIIKVRGL